tara:strand:- start:70 stop:501 length:432 start_codon:yes stop_codon:yes gene_type:complete
MTERQRDYGKVISIAVMAAIILLGVLSSCTVYRQPQMKITSVLAVTAEGDTLKLPIDVIRPIYNYNTYPTNRYPIGYNTFYYTPWRNHGFNPNINDYRPLPNNNNNPNISQSNNNSIAPRADRITNPPANPPNPAVNNPRKNN